MTIKKAILAGAAALALTAGAGSAATIDIVGGTAQSTVGNDFTVPGGFLSGLNFLSGVTININGSARVTFTEVGAESGFRSFFTAGGKEMSEFNDTDAVGETFSVDYIGGKMGVNDWVFRSTDQSGNPVYGPIRPNSLDFGVFYAGSKTGLTTFFLAYDDQISPGKNNADDNHDDYVIRVDVSAVPLPAAGWMLLAGLGGIAAMKRRKKA